MTTPILSHTRAAAGDTTPALWLYLLHGIYGSGRNWATVARRVVEERPDWGIVLVDLRLHGASLNMPGPNTVGQCANDLLQLEDHLGLPAAAVLGHSFGGKVALVRARLPATTLKHIWVIDSTLRVQEPSGSAWDIIQIARSLPDEFSSRDEVADALVQHGYARPVGQWLAMNLERRGSAFGWKIDWDGVEGMLRDYFATDVWPVVEAPPGSMHVHIVKATESNALGGGSVARIRQAEEATGRVHFHEVSGGHWVNVDNPEAIQQLLSRELQAPSSR